MKKLKLILMLQALMLGALTLNADDDCCPDGSEPTYECEDRTMVCDASECPPCSTDNPDPSSDDKECCGGTEYASSDGCCDDDNDTWITNSEATSDTCTRNVPSAGTPWTDSINVSETNTQRRYNTCGEHVEVIYLPGSVVEYLNYTIDTYTTTGTLTVQKEERYAQHSMGQSSGCGDDFRGSDHSHTPPVFSWGWSFSIGIGPVSFGIAPSTGGGGSSMSVDNISSPGGWRRLQVDLYKREVRPIADTASFSGETNIAYGCNPPSGGTTQEVHSSVYAQHISRPWGVVDLNPESCATLCCPGQGS